jgi:hypothetical protein
MRGLFIQFQKHNHYKNCAMDSVDSGVVADSCTEIKVIYDEWRQMMLLEDNILVDPGNMELLSQV